MFIAFDSNGEALASLMDEGSVRQVDVLERDLAGGYRWV
jgi:hypothetical protein